MNRRVRPPAEPLSVGRMLSWSADVLQAAGVCFAQGTDNARDEAAWLLLHALGEPLDAPIAAPDRLLDRTETRAVVELLEARIEGVPAAYLTGRTWFCGHEILVDERVLVPRSPIAELIARRFEPWCDPGRVARILDLCTGSGCIAIACAHAFPEARVDACDISPGAIEVARANVRAHRLGARVRVVQSDLFTALGEAQYDLIVSNPPYVPSAVMEALPAELRAEPRLALDGGVTGLDVVARILHHAPRHMREDSTLVVEVGDFKEELLQCFPQERFDWPRFENGGGGVFVTHAPDLRCISPPA